jgi:hypothetical protein
MRNYLLESIWTVTCLEIVAFSFGDAQKIPEIKIVASLSIPIWLPHE